MQVRNTPLLIDGDGEQMQVLVGSGGAGVYYGPSPALVQTNSATAGSTFTITAPFWIQSQDSSTAADLQLIAVPPSGGGGGGGGGSATFAGLTDVNFSHFADGWLAGYDGPSSKIVAKAPGGVFRVDDEQAVGDGVANDYSAVGNAMAKAIAVAQAGGTGIIEFNPRKTYLLNSAIGAFGVPTNMPGTLIVRLGGGTIKLSANCPTFLTVGSFVNDDVLQNIIIDGNDGVFDAGNVSASAGSGIVCTFYGQRLSHSNQRFRRFHIANAPAAAVGLGRRGIYVMTARNDPFGAPVNTISNIAIEDVDLAASGTGGNVGILLGAFQNTGTVSPPNQKYNGNGTPTRQSANVLLDDIRVERCHWDRGASPTNLDVSGGCHLIGDGLANRVRVDDCRFYRGGDVGLEVGTTMDLVVSRTVIADCWSENFFLSNNHGGSALMERQLAKYVNCTSLRTVNTASSTQGFGVAGIYGTRMGEVRFENCDALSYAPQFFQGAGSTPVNPSPGWYIQGPFRKISLKGCRASYRDIAHTASANSQVAPNCFGVQVFHADKAGVLAVDDFTFEVQGSMDNGAFTGATSQCTAVQVVFASKLTLDLRRITVLSDVTRLNGFAYKWRAVDLYGGGFNLLDNFATAGTLAGDFVVDAGTASDLSQAGGVVTSVANHSARKLLRWIATSTSSIRNAILRQMDGSIYVGGTPGATLTGFELIARLRISDDAQSELRAVLADDGSATTLRLEKVVAGVVTVLSGPTTVTRLVAGTAIGLRAKIKGDVLTADYYTNGTVPGNTTAGATTLTYTLSSTESQTFGVQAPAGFMGWGATPADAAATFDNVRNDKLGVVSGVIDGIYPAASPQPVATPIGVLSNANSNELRIDGLLRVRNIDFTTQKKDGGLELSIPDNTLKAGVVTDRIAWITPPAPATVTAPGSGVAAQNLDMYAHVLSWYGGTLTIPFMEVSQDGVTWTQVRGSSADGSMTIPPGHFWRATYSAAPTFRKVPLA